MCCSERPQIYCCSFLTHLLHSRKAARQYPNPTLTTNAFSFTRLLKLLKSLRLSCTNQPFHTTHHLFGKARNFLLLRNFVQRIARGSFKQDVRCFTLHPNSLSDPSIPWFRQIHYQNERATTSSMFSPNSNSNHLCPDLITHGPLFILSYFGVPDSNKQLHL